MSDFSFQDVIAAAAGVGVVAARSPSPNCPRKFGFVVVVLAWLLFVAVFVVVGGNNNKNSKNE